MKVNGENVQLETSVSLKEYLVSHDYKLNHIAVELNGEIIKKSDYESTILNDSSNLEIVQFMGGG